MRAWIDGQSGDEWAHGARGVGEEPPLTASTPLVYALGVAIALYVELDRREMYPIDSPYRIGRDASPPSLLFEDADEKH